MKYEIDVIENCGRKSFSCAALGHPVQFPEIKGYGEFETGGVEVFRDDTLIAKSQHIMTAGTFGGTTYFYLDLHSVFKGASTQPPHTLYAKDFKPGDHIIIDAPLLPEQDDGKARFFETYLKRHQPA